MFDIGFTELVLIAVVALLVLGPDKMPQALRSLMRGVRKIKYGFNKMTAQIEQELAIDEVKQELKKHQQVMERALQESEHTDRQHWQEREHEIKEAVSADKKNPLC